SLATYLTGASMASLSFLGVTVSEDCSATLRDDSVSTTSAVSRNATRRARVTYRDATFLAADNGMDTIIANMNSNVYMIFLAEFTPIDTKCIQ
ncbi:MAG: hypothetical protein IKC85_06315, partial [Bacteroidaceae bacterium]|nr:hypothetical protein [Bacteroidaceae bacterium]